MTTENPRAVMGANNPPDPLDTIGQQPLAVVRCHPGIF
jgi:hypothetical protein